jgi:O-antigen/teichoic acid export membrane protein
MLQTAPQPDPFRPSPNSEKSSKTAMAENSKPSLKTLAVRGSIWSMAGFGTAQALRLAGNLILTRLLFPEAFGVMALVEMVMHGIQMFSNMGLGAFVIRDPRGEEPNFINTAWTLQVIRGCGLWLVACIAAYPMAIIYQEPVLMQLLPLAGLAALINGFNSTSVLLHRRNVNLRPLVIWETASQAFGLLCMIGLAWYLRSVWALALGGVIRMSVAMITSQFLIPGRKLKFTWDRSAVHEIVRFGKWIFLSTAITFIIQQGDRALLGLLVTKQTLGLYAIATVWSRMGLQALLKMNNQVLFPIYANLYNRGDGQLRKRVFQARLGLIALFVPLMWALSLGGQWLIDLLYDARYADAGWMLQVLAAGVIGAIISTTGASILLAVGDSKRFMFLQTGRSLLLILCIVAGASLADVVGLIFGVAVSRIIDYPLVIWAIRRHGVWMPALDLGTIAVSGLVIFIGNFYLHIL